MIEEHKAYYRQLFEGQLDVGRKIAFWLNKEKRDAESQAKGKTIEEDPQVFEWIERYENLLRRCKEGDERIKTAIEELL